ncbi:L-lactate permease, partial [Candidatus Bipolaricaulota bacterium]|nr:L-lactate permease [Candidatus Bipolaricaulota bacterium]
CALPIWAAALILGVTMGGVLNLTVRLEPSVASFVSGIVGLGVGYLLTKSPWYESGKLTEEHINKSGMGFNLGFLPYYLIVGLVLLVMLPPPLASKAKEVLNFGLSFPETSTAHGWTNEVVASYNTLKLFGHPGTYIMVSVLISYLVYKFTGNWEEGYGVKIFKDTIKKTVPSSIALASMVMMAIVMTDTGMVELLARGSAKVTSFLFPLISPSIGVLGAFMTGSNTSSNILFGVFQQQNALLLEINTLIILAAQTTGGAIGNMLCPFNILLGTSTANMLGQEGEVMKRTTYIGIGFSVLIGLLVWLLS